MTNVNNDHLRMLEALMFAAEKPLSHADVADRLPDGADVTALVNELRGMYEGRGVNLADANGKWFLRTAPDLSFLLRKEVEDQRKLSRAGVETLAIIAYHQPVTRAELEDIRGVSISKGTIDVLMEAGWVRPMGRRRTPGKPVTYGTTEEFLVHFGLANLEDLPGLEELKAAGLLDSVDVALQKMERQASNKHDIERDEDQLDLEDAILEAEGEGAAPDDDDDGDDDAIDAIDEQYADSAVEEDFADNNDDDDDDD